MKKNSKKLRVINYLNIKDLKSSILASQLILLYFVRLFIGI